MPLKNTLHTLLEHRCTVLQYTCIEWYSTLAHVISTLLLILLQRSYTCCFTTHAYIIELHQHILLQYTYTYCFSIYAYHVAGNLHKMLQYICMYYLVRLQILLQQTYINSCCTVHLHILLMYTFIHCCCFTPCYINPYLHLSLLPPLTFFLCPSTLHLLFPYSCNLPLTYNHWSALQYLLSPYSYITIPLSSIGYWTILLTVLYLLHTSIFAAWFIYPSIHHPIGLSRYPYLWMHL